MFDFSTVTSHRASRQEAADDISANHLLNECVECAFNFNDPFHVKALMVLELVFQQNPEWMAPYLNRFCKPLQEVRHHSAMRSMARICMFLTAHHTKVAGEKFLSDVQFNKITEVCFLWLIEDQKVAVKVYALRSLYDAGKIYNWIYPDLQAILERDFAGGSPGYKAAAKEILRKINRSTSLL